MITSPSTLALCIETFSAPINALHSPGLVSRTQVAGVTEAASYVLAVLRAITANARRSTKYLSETIHCETRLLCDGFTYQAKQASLTGGLANFLRTASIANICRY